MATAALPGAAAGAAVAGAALVALAVARRLFPIDQMSFVCPPAAMKIESASIATNANNNVCSVKD